MTGRCRATTETTDRYDARCAPAPIVAFQHENARMSSGGPPCRILGQQATESSGRLWRQTGAARQCNCQTGPPEAPVVCSCASDVSGARAAVGASVSCSRIGSIMSAVPLKTRAPRWPMTAGSGGRRAGGPASAAAGHTPACVHLPPRPDGRLSRGFVVAAGIALLALLIAIATVRVRRQDLTGAVPAQQEAAPQPTCGGPRDGYANWGTSVGYVVP
jgi:hypothetical protein